MLEILKRTTAVAALAALPLAPVAAQTASSDSAAQGQQASGQVQELIQESRQDTGNLESAPAKADEQAEKNEELIRQQMPDASGQAQQTGQQTGGATAGQQVTEGQDTQPGVAPGAGPAQHQTGQQTGDTQQVTEGQDVQPGVAPGQGPAQHQTGDVAAGSEEDVLVATVGDAEIRRSDVIDAIGQLPPQLQQQPPEMLIPMALDQLVTRELILQEAREANLQEDDEVMALAPDTATETARENAMVQVWLDRQLRDRVTDEKVQETYDDVKAQYGDQTPALDDLRPQIENELRQQAFAEISTDLQADAEITVYGPDGQPMTQ